MRFVKAVAFLAFNGILGGTGAEVTDDGAPVTAAATQYAGDHSQDAGRLTLVSHSCPAPTTTTVFVTIYPPCPFQATADGTTTVAQTVKPTTTVLISPVQSSAVSHVSVKQFTTITVSDLWPESQATGTAKSISTTGRVDGAQTSDPPPAYTVVTDTNVHWTHAPSGVAKTTILSTHTITLSAIQTSSPKQTEQSFESVICSTMTVVGGDGRPTVTTSWIGVPPSTAASQAAASTGYTTFTIVGSDGRPTVTESSWLIPVHTETAQATVPGGISVDATVTAPPAQPSTICSTYTTIGSDGLPTAQETTWTLPTQYGTQSNAGAVTTTCYTTIGADGLPTTVDLTIPAPTPSLSTLGVSIGLPSFVSQPESSISAAGAVTTQVTVDVVGPNGSTSRVIETIVIPSDETIVGIPTIPAVVASANIPTMPLPSLTSLVPAVTTLPQGYSDISDYGTPVATLSAVAPQSVISGIGATLPGGSVILGGATLPPTMPGSPPAAYGGDGFSSTVLPTAHLAPYDSSELEGYGSSTEDPGNWASSILYGSLPSTVSDITATPTPCNTTSLSTGTWTNIIPEQTTTYTINFPYTTMVTVTVPPLVAFGKRHMKRQAKPWNNSSNTDFITRTLSVNTSLGASLSSALESTTPFSFPNATTPTPEITPPAETPSTATAPGITSPEASPSTVTTPDITSPEVTTPEVTTPEISTPTATTPAVTSTDVSTPEGTPVETSTPVETPPTSTPVVVPPVCPSGGKVGNLTLDFDNLQPGPLLNPDEDFWFSEGFLIAPPSSPPYNSYVPSSGGQLVEFVPPALSPVLIPDGTGDTAEIGVGPNAISPCHRFNFYGANLGCAAEGVEQWCEFNIQAYTYNETSTSEASLAWSEIRRIPACPNFPSGTCALTPVSFDGYNNLTSILISVRVGLELRAWWADDLRLGWTDNSCDAASCRMSTFKRRVKRDKVKEIVRRGVWQWTPWGLRKLANDYIWAASAST